VLSEKNMNKLQSERLGYFPNVNSLMKISLGLIFFTVLSTVFVYAETITVDVDGTPFDISYTATGMTVTGIESDIESFSLIFSVDVTDLNGILDVEFERSFFDSIYDDTDDLFFILADGDEAISEEIQTNSQSRSLTIKVPSGTEDLEIIGSVFDISKSEIIVPVVTAPVVTAPVVTASVISNPSNNECGPGTVLENNVCVLDERCGPGTVLENNVCVLDYVPVNSSSSSNSKELIMGVTVAFVIAGVIGIIFALISKANRNKH